MFTKNLSTIATLTIILTVLLTGASSELMRRAQHINNEGLKLIEEFEGFALIFILTQW